MNIIHEEPKSMIPSTFDRPRRSRLCATLFLLCLLATELVLLSTGPAEAQTRCSDDQTFEECWEETFEAIKAKRTAALAEQTSATTTELRSEPTGAEADLAGIRSNTRDFLPILALSGLLGESSRDENDEDVIVLDLNFLVPWVSDSKNFKLRGLLNTQPTVGMALAGMLPEEGRDEQVQALEKNLPDDSDVGVSISYSQELLNWGRGFENYRYRYLALLDTADDALPDLNIGVDEAMKLTGEVGRLFPDGIAGGDALALSPDAISQALEERCRQDGRPCPSEARRTATELRQWFEAFLDAELDAYQRLDALYRDKGIDSFAELLDNQPQLIFELSHRDRDSLVGADETVGTFRLELSKTNLKNAMSHECHEQLETERYLAVDPTVRAACLEEYSRYATEHRNGIEKGYRLTFSIDYADVDDISIPRSVLGLSSEETEPDDESIVIPGSDRFDVSLGWGRTFNGDGGNPLVFDLVATYERLEESDDTFRHDDRFLATLNITPSFGGVEVPFSIVYANHGEFLAEVDNQLSAHIGLRYDLGGVQ